MFRDSVCQERRRTGQYDGFLKRYTLSSGNERTLDSPQPYDACPHAS